YYSYRLLHSFTVNVLRPVLMGSRYDQFADHFLARISASVFAFNTNKLLQSAPKNTFKQMSHIDSIIYYDSSKQAESFKLANQLRNNHLRVLVHPITQLDSI